MLSKTPGSKKLGRTGMFELNEFWASRGTPKISECNSGKCLFHSLPHREFPEYLVEWKESYICSSAVCYLQTTGLKRAVRYQLPYLFSHWLFVYSQYCTRQTIFYKKMLPISSTHSEQFNFVGVSRKFKSQIMFYLFYEIKLLIILWTFTVAETMTNPTILNPTYRSKDHTTVILLNLYTFKQRESLKP